MRAVIETPGRGTISSVPTRSGQGGILDRRAEMAALDRLVGAISAGESRALVVVGEPGVGKTTLLERLVERAPGCHVVRAAGLQSEMELAFAGLHQLCVPLLDRLERLPGPQRHALETAFGLTSAPAPDRFLVGLAVLGLLSEAAREGPLLCVIDDAQWLDRASSQTLAFVARRLVTESVALVIAVRSVDEVPEFSGLPELRVEGLPEAEARALLRSALHGPLDEEVLDRIVAESRGNPLALLELPRGLPPTELAGGFGLPSAWTLPAPTEEGFQQRLESLPDDTRTLLLLAAAEPVGDPVTVWRAAARLGIGIQAGAPAAAAGLLEIGERVRFRHPLVRSAVYRAASLEDRRSAHAAVAQVTDPETDLDRRAWHAAQAAAGPDEDVAADLERSAGQARARGGLAAAAAFLRRAAVLTHDPDRRAQRAMEAAQTTYQAGMSDAALRVLSVAEAGSLDKLSRARASLLRAQVALTERRSDAGPLLLDAAAQLEPLDVRLAREAYLEALWAAWSASALASAAQAREAARVAMSAPPAPTPPRPADLLLDGLATDLVDGHDAGMPIVKRALSCFRSSDLSAEEGLRWYGIAGTLAFLRWDDVTWETMAVRHLQLARGAGALAVLPVALNANICVHTQRGELAEAAALAEEAAGAAEAIGSQYRPYGSLLLAAWRGREAEADELLEAYRVKRAAYGPPNAADLVIVDWTKALLNNSLGRYEDALATARSTIERPPAIGLTPWVVLVELIEAASRTGNLESGARALQQLIEPARASGTDLALGLLARCRALLTKGQAAEASYREAIDRLGRTRFRGERARAHLLYGEWLRRQNRRMDARDQLRIAHGMFTSMGAEAFAGRTARELQGTGETVRKRGVESGGALTAQETQIARLVGDGLSNGEIAARLFISPRTVEWHLNKIFTKLDITSRRQLHRHESRARPSGGGPADRRAAFRVAR